MNRFLPLYFCFDFRTNELGYRLISDDALVTYFPEDDPNVTEHEEWPAEHYPEQFPLPQGKPSLTYLNPDYPNNARAGLLAIFPLMPAEPVQGIHLFGPWGDNVGVRR